jgi:RNA polymerase sigma factor (sigma-70 family)
LISLHVNSSSTASDRVPVADEANARWFAAEVHAHDQQLKAYLRGSFPSIRDVDDVAQESYLRVWKARATQSIRSAKGFLFQIARHVATDVLRRDFASPIKGVTDLAALTVFDDKPNSAEVACSQEEISLLADAIDALPARCREVFILRKIQRLPQKEIARLLGISEQTVQVLVLRGMKRCEKFFHHRGD